MSEFLTNFQSKNTILSYGKDLEQFLSFCQIHSSKQDLHPTEIGETICVLWLNYLRDMHVKPSTLARKITAVSSFFKFCQRKKIMHTNPVEFLNRPQVAQIGKTNILTKNECLQIFECILKRMEYARIQNNLVQFKLWKKRYAILYTLFSVGMRISELCQLKYEDLEKIDDSIYRLHLSAKGNERHAPLIHENTALVLMDYMKTFLIHQNGQSMFGNMNRSTIHQLIKKCIALSGIKKKVSAHSLRASLATHLHQIGIPLGHIKELLNHKNIATTILYTRVSNTEMQENADLLDT